MESLLSRSVEGVDAVQKFHRHTRSNRMPSPFRMAVAVALPGAQTWSNSDALCSVPFLGDS